jgi:holo-[acyl-carrier protein] synthase
MGSLLVGIDLVQISQIVASMDRFGSRFLERIFTADEIRDCGQSAHLAAGRYAARFAAKEATMKVLRPADEALPFRSIEVRHGAGAVPEIVLHDRAKAMAVRAGVRSLALSLSHEADYATAIVVAELESPRSNAVRSRLGASKVSRFSSRAATRRTYRKKSGSKR